MSTSGEPNNNSTSETTTSNAPSSGASGNQTSSEPQTNADNLPLLDYKALALFLLEPLVDGDPDLHVSSEVTAHGKRVSLRVSLGQADRGRTFGRGGRNIRAIRTILRSAGKNVGQNVSLEIIGGDGQSSGSKPKPKPRQPGDPRPAKPKLKR